LAASGNITLNGATFIKLDGATNDLLAATAGLTYGGTLNLVNIGGSTLAAGNSFQIFAANTFSGAFTSITPPTPGPGLAWDTTQLNLGLISVVSATPPVIVNAERSGDDLIFNGTGGTANSSYYVLTTTNLTSAVWTLLATNSYDANGNFSVTNFINPNIPYQFFHIK